MDGVHAVDRFSYEWPWLVGILALVLLVLLIVSCYFCWRSHECSGEMHYIDSTKPRSHSYYDCPIHGPVLIGGKTKSKDKDIQILSCPIVKLNPSLVVSLFQILKCYQSISFNGVPLWQVCLLDQVCACSRFSFALLTSLSVTTMIYLLMNNDYDETKAS